MASAFRKMLMMPEFRRVVIALEGASAEALEATDHVLRDESLRRAVLHTASHFESEATHPLSRDQQMVASLVPIMFERLDITRFLANVMATIPRSETTFPQSSERALALLRLEFQKEAADTGDVVLQHTDIRPTREAIGPR